MGKIRSRNPGQTGRNGRGDRTTETEQRKRNPTRKVLANVCDLWLRTRPVPIIKQRTTRWASGTKASLSLDLPTNPILMRFSATVEELGSTTSAPTIRIETSSWSWPHLSMRRPYCPLPSHTSCGGWPHPTCSLVRSWASQLSCRSIVPTSVLGELQLRPPLCFVQREDSGPKRAL